MWLKPRNLKRQFDHDVLVVDLFEAYIYAKNPSVAPEQKKAGLTQFY